MSAAAETITTEWTAEKCLDKRMQNKKSSKHKLGNGRNSWSKEQADALHPISKKQLKQQQQQRQRQHPLKKRLNI